METEVRQKRTRDEVIEIIVVAMLGITALTMAWAGWIESLHGGNQAGNYTTSNNLAAEGNSEYNAGIQSLMQDAIVYNEYNDLAIDLAFATSNGNEEEAARLEWKQSELESKSMTPELQEAISWAMEQEATTEEYVSPFDKEGFVDTYFESAKDLLAKSDEALKQGEKDNTNGDSFGLVAVVYSVVLFLLGISGTFKGAATKVAILVISLAAFAVATIYMATLPMPTGFDIASFFGGGS